MSEALIAFHPLIDDPSNARPSVKESSSIISEIINDFEGWNEAVKKSYKKKFGEINLTEVGAILKAKRFLYQRGFNELQIQSVFGDA